jgi:hypothetical protein
MGTGELKTKSRLYNKNRVYGLCFSKDRTPFLVVTHQNDVVFMATCHDAALSTADQCKPTQATGAAYRPAIIHAMGLLIIKNGVR